MGNVVGAQAVQVRGAFRWKNTIMCTPRGKILKNGVWNAWEMGIFGWEIGHFEWEIFGKCFWEIGDLLVWNRRPPRRKEFLYGGIEKLEDARSYFVGLYFYGCRYFTKRQPINQPKKINLCWRVFHFLRLHTLEPVTLQKLFHWPTKLDDQRTFNSYVRNTMISNLTRLNQLIARE